MAGTCPSFASTPRLGPASGVVFEVVVLQAYVRCFPLLAMAVSLMVAWLPQGFHTETQRLTSVFCNSTSQDSDGLEPPDLLPTAEARFADQLRAPSALTGAVTSSFCLFQ